MPAKFADACKEARATIEVPSVPLDAIRRGANAEQRSPRVTYLRALVVAGCALALVAAVAATWKNTRVWVGDGHVRVTSKSLVTVDNPTPADLAAAARAADFPVTLPPGLPKGATPVSLVEAGSSALMIRYRFPGAARRSQTVPIILVNPKSFDLKRANSTAQGDLGDAKWFQIGVHIVALFPVHGEIVVVPKSVMTTHELNAIEQAMNVGKEHVVGENGVENPTPADLENFAARDIGFHVVLPSGLPAGAVPIAVIRMGSAILIQYNLPGAWRASNHIGSIWLADSRHVREAERAVALHMPHTTIRERFTVGEETVLIPSTSFTVAELAHIRASMQR